MKPDIVSQPFDFRAIKGYVGVICSCGRALHLKNKPQLAGQGVVIECPCGFSICTIYTHETVEN